MLGSLLFGALAGYLVVHAEPVLEGLLDRITGDDIKIDALDFRVLTFAVMLAVAGVATALARGDGSLVLGAVGGGLGYFGTRIYAFLKDPDGTRGDPEHDWSGDLNQRRSVPGDTERAGGDRDAEAIDAVRAALADRNPDPVYPEEPASPGRRGESE